MITVSIDDNKSSAEALAEMMQEIDPHGTHLYFTHPVRGLDYIRDNPIDVCFTDIMMPGMSGIELAKNVKEAKPRCNIVFVTAFAEYALNAVSLRASGYLLKPVSKDDLLTELDNLRFPPELHRTHRIEVRCFGKFEVYADGNPLIFKRLRTKEFFAYLVDQKGKLVTNGEMISILWEDQPESERLKAQIRHLYKDLKDTLHPFDNDILIRSSNVYAIKDDKIDCDYYEYLKGNPAAVNLYQGEYMSQYSWGEFRLF